MRKTHDPRNASIPPDAGLYCNRDGGRMTLFFRVSAILAIFILTTFIAIYLNQVRSICKEADRKHYYLEACE